MDILIIFTNIMLLSKQINLIKYFILGIILDILTDKILGTYTLILTILNYYLYYHHIWFKKLYFILQIILIFILFNIVNIFIFSINNIYYSYLNMCNNNIMHSIYWYILYFSLEKYSNKKKICQL
ncbi:rod shape-determining protein MreD [Enterobacteriaceae endosymbiont of Macroplea mutica]|uniref:rod shape-determining protein MreD n=1 Tax=Enterobacteriaceae endosymbiont of Macroplea mutica TaxID=2675791 RepID=UPI00144978A2|nr:rod shape-determining protein MreD [Enterobacteriaceae endosymbiont of Macroplea mutica]